MTDWKPIKLYMDGNIVIMIDPYRKSIDTATIKYFNEDVAMITSHLHDTPFNGGW